MHPDYPPRARIEWVIAAARVVLAAGALLGIWLAPTTPTANETFAYMLLLLYLLHSAATLALVRKPVAFARGWGLATHLFDLTVFTCLVALSDGATSPFYMYFLFSVICGALRWEAKGALVTTAAALSIYATISASQSITDPSFAVDRFVIRMAQLAVIGGVLAYIGSYHPRTLREVLRFAAWPHLIPQHETDAVSDIIERANEILPADVVVVAWHERDEDFIKLAWSTPEGVQWARHPLDGYEPLVSPSLRGASFQARDVSDASGRVTYWYKGRLRELRAAPVNERLREQFAMRAVQSSPITGGLVSGRVFWLGRRRVRTDDLIVGDVVARLAGSSLESAYLAASLQETAALNERLRVARDLHDSVLQSLAGTGLQLAVAARVIERDPDAAKRTMADLQAQLEQSERDIRGLIGRLRPRSFDDADTVAPPVPARLRAFARRVEEQWKLRVEVDVSPALDELPVALKQQLVLMLQEAVINAARHARASTITASLGCDDQSATARIEDDGKGFPFSGSYDLATLNALDIGPLTLRERVAELRGNLHVQSRPTGSAVRIVLPVTSAVSPDHADHAGPR